MTCIVGIEKDGTVYMGGDSAAVSGMDVWIMSEPKVFRNGPFLIGYTSSFRMGQLLQYMLRIPDNPGMDDLEFLITKFVPLLRDCLKENGFATVSNNEETGGVFLLGYRGKLYKVGSDFQVSRSVDGYNACGCGESFALGAMHLASRSMNADVAVEYSLAVAAHFSAGVRPPFHVLAGS